MYVLELLRTSSPNGLRKIALITCLAGMANAILIGLINVAAGMAALGEPSVLAWRCSTSWHSGFITSSNLTSLREANGFMQERLGELRVRIADKLRRSDLRSLEQLGRGDIYTTVAQEINQLSQNFPLLTSAAQSVFLLVFCLAYIAVLSQISFVVVFFATLLGLVIFLERRAALNKVLVTVHAREAEMLESITHFTEGFQEIRINADKNDALFEPLHDASGRSRNGCGGRRRKVGRPADVQQRFPVRPARSGGPGAADVLSGLHRL